MQGNYLVYVDDDPDDIDFFKQAMASIESIGLMTFSNAPEAIRYVSTTPHRPQLIVLDNNMPVMTGLQAARILKGQPTLQSTGIYLYTTNVSPEDVEVIRSLGLKYHLKPSSWVTIHHTIRSMLNNL
jgi:CheY-like chemotaxis protein